MLSTDSQPLVRKQIMLSNENLEKLNSIAQKGKVSVAHVVRNAIDSYEPDSIGDDRELRELVSLLNEKLDSAIEDTENTHAFLLDTLNNLSTRKDTK